MSGKFRSASLTSLFLNRSEFQGAFVRVVCGICFVFQSVRHEARHVSNAGVMFQSCPWVELTRGLGWVGLVVGHCCFQ